MTRGGTERQLVYLASLLPTRGIDATFVVLAPDGPLENELAAAGARIIRPAFTATRPLRTLLQAQLIAREVREWKPQVVHSFLSEPHFAAALAIMLASPKPALVHSRRSTNFYAERRPIAARLERAMHQRCAALVGNSRAIAQELLEESGTPEKISVIHNGIPVAELDRRRPSRAEARTALALPQDGFVLAVVANLYPYKRHTDVLSALAIIQDRLPAPWCLLLAGRDGGARRALELQARASGLQQHVLFLGEVNDAAAVHAAADVELLVSIQEGLSNAVLEAMAAGVALVVSDSGGNTDLIEHGDNGLVVRTGDPDAVAAALLKLAGDRQLRRNLGSACRERVVRCFSMESCADKHVDLWQGLASVWDG